MDISKRVIYIRKNSNLTQSEFGKKLGVSRDVIFNIENNRAKPKELFLEHLCDIFNVNKEWLFNGKGEIYCTKVQNKLLGNSIANIMESNNETLHKIINKLSEIDEDYLDLINDLITALSKK